MRTSRAYEKVRKARMKSMGKLHSQGADNRKNALKLYSPGMNQIMSKGSTKSKVKSAGKLVKRAKRASNG